MKLNCNRELVNLEGKPLVDRDPDTMEMFPMTVGRVIASGLNLSKEAEADPGRKYDLMIKTYKGDEVELTADDIVLIEKCVKMFPPLVSGQLISILEGKS